MFFVGFIMMSCCCVFAKTSSCTIETNKTTTNSKFIVVLFTAAEVKHEPASETDGVPLDSIKNPGKYSFFNYG